MNIWTLCFKKLFENNYRKPQTFFFDANSVKIRQELDLESTFYLQTLNDLNVILNFVYMIPLIHLQELEIKEIASSASFLVIYLKFDTNGEFSTRLWIWQKRRVQFAIINCSHLDSNIPTTPVYGVYISQLIGLC